MTKWKKGTLGDLIKIKHGYAFKSQYFKKDGPFVLLTPGNFKEEGGFKDQGQKQKMYDGPVKDEYILSENDLLVAMTEQSRGLLGSAIFVPEDKSYLHNQRLGLIDDLTKVDRNFLYYLFNSEYVREQIQASATGTKVRHTSPQKIYDVKIGIPDLIEQKKIGLTLKNFDDLISLNQKKIELLERMIKRLYNEWFIKFKFPNSENTELIDSQCPDYGLIPKGWKVEPISVIADFQRGKSYRSSELVECGGMNFINLKSVKRGGGYRRDGLKRFQGKIKNEQYLYEGDIIVAITDMTQDRAIVGRAARVPTGLNGETTFSMDLVKIIPKNKKFKDWIYSTLRYSSIAETIKLYANGANVLHLNPQLILDYMIIIPKLDVVEKFTDVASNIFKEIDSLELQNEKLAQMRDILLPKLIMKKALGLIKE